MESNDKMFILELTKGNAVVVGVGSLRYVGTVTKVTNTRIDVSYANSNGITVERSFHRLAGKYYGSGGEIGGGNQFYFTRIVSLATPHDKLKAALEVTRERQRQSREQAAETRRNNLLSELNKAVQPNAKAGTQTTSTSGGPDRITGYWVRFDFKTREEFDEFVKKAKGLVL